MTLAEKWNDFTIKIKEQEWYQQAQNSFDQLAPEQQTYVKWGSIGGAFALVLYFTFSILSSANGIKNEYFEKQELLQLVNQAGDEIRRLKGQNAGFTQSVNQSWKSVFSNLVTAQGLPPDAAEILKESPGPSKTVIQETLLEVQIQPRLLTTLLFQMEHGTPPVKLKGMAIDTANDGLLTAKLVASGFMPKPEKPEKTR